MLQGWVLTDHSCPSPGCSVPMMHSPSGRLPVTEFCVNCNEIPGGLQAKPAASVSDSSTTSISHISRSSTPPTDVPSALSSPVFAPPVETQESQHRREQSDRASSEIGKRLLKGWAMLGDECPNTRCYGVPLVRPPKVGGGKDPRKECVICGTVYVTEVDWAGREHLVPAHSDPAVNETPNLPNSRQTGKAHVQEETIPPHASKTKLSSQEAPALNDATLHSVPLHSSGDGSIQSGATLQALAESANALQSTLRRLSVRLATLSSTRASLDTISIGSTADAINKVTQALIHVRQLQWSEGQVQEM